MLVRPSLQSVRERSDAPELAGQCVVCQPQICTLDMRHILEIFDRCHGDWHHVFEASG